MRIIFSQQGRWFRVRRWTAILLVSLFTPVFLNTAPANAVPGAPGFNPVVLGLITDNDFSAYMGDDRNVTRLFWQNDVQWGQQVAAMQNQDVIPRAGETFIYVLAMGGDPYTGTARTTGDNGTGGQEDWAGAINGKSLLEYAGAQVAIGKSSVDVRTKILDGYLLLNDFLPNYSSSQAIIEQGTYTPTLLSVQTGLTDAIWSSAYTSTSVASSITHPSIRAPRTNCTVSCNAARGPGFSGKGWDFPDGSAVVFRFPLSAASLPVSAGNGQVIVDWEAPVGGEAVTDYLIYYKETSEPDTAFKYFSIVTAPTTVETVTGLTNGTSYTFRVTSRNSSGVSAPTDSRSVTPTGPASQPLNLSYAALGGSITVNFSAPINNGGFSITNYQYSIDSGTTWVTRTPEAITSPITITGLNDATTYQVKLRAITPYGFGTASSAISAIPVLNVSKTVTFLKGTLDTVTGLPSSQSQAAGYVLTIPAGPTRQNFTFIGWKEGSTSYQPSDTYTVGASNPTFTAQWIQDSLYGTENSDRSKKITWNISANEAIDATVSSDNGSTVRIVIPANALAAGTEVVFWRLLNQNLAISKVGAGNDYIVNIGLSWSIGDDISTPITVQIANSPIQMTITNDLFESGAKAWKILRGVSTLLGQATTAGRMDISFTEDPLIVAANVAATPVVPPSQQQVALPVIDNGAAKRAAEQKELMEILALIPKIGELTLSLGETTKALYSTKCVKGKATKYVKKGSKCPKGFVRKR
jgi:uncharacterized repeat protein (TIGR02543 family)